MCLEQYYDDSDDSSTRRTRHLCIRKQLAAERNDCFGRNHWSVANCNQEVRSHQHVSFLTTMLTMFGSVGVATSCDLEMSSLVSLKTLTSESIPIELIRP